MCKAHNLAGGYFQMIATFFFSISWLQTENPKKETSIPLRVGFVIRGSILVSKSKVPAIYPPNIGLVVGTAWLSPYVFSCRTWVTQTCPTKAGHESHNMSYPSRTWVALVCATRMQDMSRTAVSYYSLYKQKFNWYTRPTLFGTWHSPCVLLQDMSHTSRSYKAGHETPWCVLLGQKTWATLVSPTRQGHESY